MRTLSNAVQRKEAGGKLLPPVFPLLDRKDINFRRGNVHVIAGLPGAGKTVLAMEMVKRYNEAQIPCLYVVPDSDELTIAGRYLLPKMNQPLRVIEKTLQDNPKWAAERWLEQLEYVWWHFDPVDLPQIQDMLDAFIEPWGQPPAITVIDNLIDVDVAGTEQEALRAAVKSLKFLARRYDTAVVILHHTSEAVEPVKGDPGQDLPPAVCQPRTALWGKDARSASLALTVAYVPGVPGHGGTIAVAPVKNRHGRADPSGRTDVRIPANLDRMILMDREYTQEALS